MKNHQYRVTIEHLSTPHDDEPLDAPLVFDTSSADALMLLFMVNRLRADAGANADSSIPGIARRRYSTRPL